MKPEKARLVLAGLKEAGVNFAAGVPDAQFIQVYRMVAARPRHSIRRHGERSRSRGCGDGSLVWRNETGFDHRHLWAASGYISPGQDQSAP